MFFRWLYRIKITTFCPATSPCSVPVWKQWTNAIDYYYWRTICGDTTIYIIKIMGKERNVRARTAADRHRAMGNGPCCISGRLEPSSRVHLTQCHPLSPSYYASHAYAHKRTVKTAQWYHIHFESHASPAPCQIHSIQNTLYYEWYGISLHPVIS